LAAGLRPDPNGEAYLTALVKQLKQIWDKIKIRFFVYLNKSDSTSSCCQWNRGGCRRNLCSW